MKMPSQSLNVAVIQNGAGCDPDANLRGVEQLLSQVTAVDLIAVPEVFACRGSDEATREVAEPVPDGRVCRTLAAWAVTRHCWVLAGSVIERAGARIYNTSVLFDRQGQVAAVYRKIHLFEAYLDHGQAIRESDVYAAGAIPVSVDLEGWRFGLAICYDVRFPELFRLYSAQGAHGFFLPANFTQRTGQAHWETLVRARAIENQAYVLAPDQCGVNPVTDVKSHGHSLVVGPWGEILAQAGDEEAVLHATLDPATLDYTRRRVPVLSHRRL